MKNKNSKNKEIDEDEVGTVPGKNLFVQSVIWLIATIMACVLIGLFLWSAYAGWTKVVWPWLIGLFA